MSAVKTLHDYTTRRLYSDWRNWHSWASWEVQRSNRKDGENLCNVRKREFSNSKYEHEIHYGSGGTKLISSMRRKISTIDVFIVSRTTLDSQFKRNCAGECRVLHKESLPLPPEMLQPPMMMILGMEDIIVKYHELTLFTFVFSFELLPNAFHRS